jgi:hypothetical protein
MGRSISEHPAIHPIYDSEPSGEYELDAANPKPLQSGIVLFTRPRDIPVRLPGLSSCPQYTHSVPSTDRWPATPGGARTLHVEGRDFRLTGATIESKGVVKFHKLGRRPDLREQAPQACLGAMTVRREYNDARSFGWRSFLAKFLL